VKKTALGGNPQLAGFIIHCQNYEIQKNQKVLTHSASDRTRSYV